MFKVLSGEKKRRVISPATITASVAAHLLLVAGFVYAASAEPARVTAVEPDTVLRYVELEPKAPPPPDVEQPAPPPPPADQPVAPPVPGETLEVEQVTKVPDVLPPPDPTERPIDLSQYSGIGRPGDYIGPRTDEPRPPTGDPGPPAGPATDYVPGEFDVEKRPVLDRNGLSRALERHYPSVLRQGRVSGRVVIELIVDENGRPRPGSARVIETTHPAFGEAALRAVDRFRFTPAEMMGTPVPVRVTIPIQWTVPN